MAPLTQSQSIADTLTDGPDIVLTLTRSLEWDSASTAERIELARQISRETSGNGTVRHAIVSPDGRLLAFAWPLAAMDAK